MKRTSHIKAIAKFAVAAWHFCKKQYHKYLDLDRFGLITLDRTSDIRLAAAKRATDDLRAVVENHRWEMLGLEDLGLA